MAGSADWRKLTDETSYHVRGEGRASSTCDIRLRTSAVRALRSGQGREHMQGDRPPARRAQNTAGIGEARFPVRPRDQRGRQEDDMEVEPVTCEPLSRGPFPF